MNNKVIIFGKEYIEKQSTFEEVKRLISQDKKYMTPEECDAADEVLQRLKYVMDVKCHGES